MLREFRDETGVKWRVWDVRPAAPMFERRLAVRRGAGREDYPGANRRSFERRQARVGQVSGGWLAFDSVLGRRRLMQIPGGWAEVGDEQLCEWCQVATAAESRLEWGRSIEI